MKIVSERGSGRLVELVLECSEAHLNLNSIRIYQSSVHGQQHEIRNAEARLTSVLAAGGRQLDRRIGIGVGHLHIDFATEVLLCKLTRQSHGPGNRIP